MKALRQELRPLIGTLAGLSLAINLLYLVPSLFMLQVFDRVLPTASGETLLVLLIGAAVALGIAAALDYVRTRLQQLVGLIIDERLSPPVVTALVGRLARAPHEARADGVRDVSAVRTVFAANGLLALFDAPWILAYIAVIWACHWSLGAAAAGAAVLMLVLAWLNDRLSRRSLAALQQDGRRAGQYVESSLRNAEVLQALGMTGNLIERWRELQRRMASAQVSTGRAGVAFTSAAKCLRQAIQVLMMALGAYLVLTQTATPGVMIATTILLGRAVQPVEQLVASWRPLADARAAWRRLVELSGDFDAGGERLSLPRPEGRLAVESIAYRPRGSETPILAGVAFQLAAGEALAVIGPSAAGKSTLARLLAGIWAPSSGCVRLDGADIARWPRHELGPWIGYVPQDVELFDGTVAENIARLGKADAEGVIAAAKRANAHDMILGLPKGYDTPAGEQGARLSPGQRQRVALARALYGDPRFVVLDEPNSNLDGAGEVALAQALSALRREGITSVVVTHRPALIAHVDKILMLAAGRVQQFGPAAQVMKAMQQQQAQLVAAEKAA
jgi:ATP-binding cassette subfamily C exporter for protease/lipase/ATP-binding cassette subfamily C protein EexD